MGRVSTLPHEETRVRAASRTTEQPAVAQLAESTAADEAAHDPQPGLPPAEIELPLIGQSEIAETLRSSVERGFTLGLPALVALEGERGAGKTRLLIYASEFAARIAQEVRVYYATCRDGDGGHGPFSRILLERFEVTPSTSLTAVRAQMTTLVGEALGTTDAIRVAETTHLLGYVAGIPFPDSPFLKSVEGDPAELRKRAHKALRRLFEGESQKRPVLLLLDNMHLAEPEVWEMVGALANGEGHITIVVAGDVGTTKHVADISAKGEKSVASIKPLREEDVAAMLLVLVPTLEELPEPLVAAVAHRSRGNPALLRELVFSLFEANLFKQSGTGVIVDLERLHDADVPVTAEDAVNARLSRLNERERSVLEYAAIVGNVFWVGAVLAQLRCDRESDLANTDAGALWPGDDDAKALAATLARLEEKGVIQRAVDADQPGTEAFSFVYRPTRDHVYDHISAEIRTKSHGIVARYLSVLAEYARESVAALIAPHLEKAGLPARAGRAYFEAAAAEHRRMQTHSALRLIEKALPLIGDDDTARKLNALHEHGSLLTTFGRYDDAEKAFGAMLHLSWQFGAANKGGAALNRLARIARARGAEDRAVELLGRALELFRSAGDLRGVASTLDDLAQVLRLRGSVERALEAVNEALNIRRAHGDAQGEAVSLMTIGLIEFSRGRLERAEAHFQQGLEIRQRISDVEGIAQAAVMLGAIAYERGDRAKAVEAWADALARARETGNARTQIFMLNNIGEAHLNERRFDEARKFLNEGLELAQGHGDQRAHAEIARNLGLLALRNGDDDAEARLMEALSLAQAYGGKEALGLVYRALGALRGQTVFSETGEVDKRAEENYLVSIDMLRESGNEKEAARSIAELGLHLIERGELDNAKERLREARALMRRIGLAEVTRVEETLKELGA